MVLWLVAMLQNPLMTRACLFFAFQLLNGAGDMLDLLSALQPGETRWSKMVAEHRGPGAQQYRVYVLPLLTKIQVVQALSD